MTDIFKHSLIGRFFNKIAALWGESFVFWLISRDTNDAKIKNSGIYKFTNQLINACCGGLIKLGRNLDRLIIQSVLFSSIISLGGMLARAFKSSFVCRLIERIFEFEFDFSGVKLYQLIVMLVVFITPIVPTMICAGLSIIAFILFVIDCIRGKVSPVRLDATGFMILMLVAVFGFFAVFSLAAASSLKIWLIYTAFMLFFFLVVQTASTKERLYKLSALAVFSGLLVSAFGIYQRFFGDDIGHAWLDEEMFGDISVRVYSTLGNPNVLGEYLLLMIPLCAALLWTRKTALSRLYYLGTLGVMLVCMLFTQSRGCWLGLILAAAVFAVFVDKRLVILGIVAMFLLPFVMPESIIARFSSIGNVNDSSTSYRLYIWLGTIKMLRDFGIYGIGLGSDAFNKIYPFYSYSSIIAPHSHNIYLQLLCESGITGLAVFLATMLVSLKKMFLTALTDKKGFAGVVSVGIVSGLLGFLMQGAFDYVWYNYRVFLLFWIVIAIGISAGRVMDDKAISYNQ